MVDKVDMVHSGLIVSTEIQLTFFLGPELLLGPEFVLGPEFNLGPESVLDQNA